jgi:hypothetical protein
LNTFRTQKTYRTLFTFACHPNKGDTTLKKSCRPPKLHTHDITILSTVQISLASHFPLTFQSKKKWYPISARAMAFASGRLSSWLIGTGSKQLLCKLTALAARFSLVYLTSLLATWSSLGFGILAGHNILLGKLVWA